VLAFIVCAVTIPCSFTDADANGMLMLPVLLLHAMGLDGVENEGGEQASYIVETSIYRSAALRTILMQQYYGTTGRVHYPMYYV
jgi:hypothetical protein